MNTTPEQMTHVAINGTAGIRWEKILYDILHNPILRNYVATRTGTDEETVKLNLLRSRSRPNAGAAKRADNIQIKYRYLWWQYYRQD